MFRALLALVVLAGPAQAGTVLVIDDFTEPAEVRLPEGPERVVTPGVGALGADRTIRTTSTDPFNLPPQARADINVTSPGEYFVQMDDPGEVTFITLGYTFPTHDFSPYDAIILDITTWPEIPSDPEIAHVPSLRVVATEAIPRPFIYLLVREFGRGVRPGRLVLPLDSFTNRAGGPVDADWSVINAFQITVGSGNAWGPWEISIDRVYLGPAVPEPSTICLITGCVGWLVVSGTTSGWCSQSAARATSSAMEKLLIGSMC